MNMKDAASLIESVHLLTEPVEVIEIGVIGHGNCDSTFILEEFFIAAA